MALNGLFCADVPLRNYSLTLQMIFVLLDNISKVTAVRLHHLVVPVVSI